MAWDARHFYFAAQVRDDLLSYATDKTKAPWFCDSLQLYFRSTADGRDTGRYKDRVTFRHLPYPFFGVSLTNEATRNVFLPTGCNSVARPAEDGWVVEAAIPWDVIGYEVRAGDVVRFAIVLVDSDPGQKSVWGQLVWMWDPHGTDNGRNWSKLRFAEAGAGFGGAIHFSPDAQRGSIVALRAALDVASAGLRLTSLRVADEEGKTLHGVAIARALQDHHTAIVTDSFVPGDAADKQCTAVLTVTDVEGTETTLSARLRPAAILAQGTPTSRRLAELRQLVTVDESRYASQPPELPARMEVTRESYLEIVRLFHERDARARLAWLRQPEPYPNVSANLRTAKFFAFDYHLTKHDESAVYAVDFIRAAHSVMINGDRKKNPNTAPAHHSPITVLKTWQWLEDSGHLNEEIRELLREILVGAVPRFPEGRAEHGNFNRPFAAALRGEILLHFVPDGPDADKWRQYIEDIWNDFWRYKDTDENTVNYNALWLRYLIDWVEVRGTAEKVFADPDIRRLFERYMLQVLPMGTLPHYGDTCGWNVEWGHWIQIFELGAKITGDGRFKWAAHRLFDYGSRQVEDIFSWGYTGGAAAESLMQAYLTADESIEATPPENDLAVLTRARVTRTSPEVKRKRRQSFQLHGERMPAKLVLRSSASPGSMAMMFDLCPGVGHSPGVAPNLVALVDRQSVLLMDQAYMERETEDHNTVWVEDYEGIRLLETPEEIQVLESADVGPLAYAKVRVENYKKYPVDLTRTIVFAKASVVLVKDTVHFRQSFRTRVGPVYNFRVLGPEIGQHWVNGYIGDRVPVRGIGPNQPVYTRWKNPPRDLLIYFLPRAGGTLEVFNRLPKDRTNTVPYRVRYHWRGTPKAGESVVLSAVLLPHAPMRQPSQLAGAISTLTDSVDATAVRVSLPDGRLCWVSTGPVDSKELTTDAHAVVAIGDGKQVASVGLCQGSRLDVLGQSIVREQERKNLSR